MQSAENKLTEFLHSFPPAYREGNLVLAYYAAFPPVFNVEILYLFWKSFNVYHREGMAMKIHPVSVSDILQASFCHEISTNLFELDEDIQDFLASKPPKYFKSLQIIPDTKDLAKVTLFYAEKQLNKHKNQQYFKDVLYWKSLATLDPDLAWSQIIRSLESISKSPGRKSEEVSLLFNLAGIQKELAGSEETEAVFSKSAVLTDYPGKKSLFRKRIKNASLIKNFLKEQKTVVSKKKEPEKEWTDEELIKAIQGGGKEREESLRYINSHYYEPLKRWMLQNGGTDEDCRDVFNKSLVAFMQNIQQGKFRGESMLINYFLAIARWTWLGDRRKNRDYYFEPLDPIFDKEQDTPEAQMLSEEERKKLLFLIMEEIGPKAKDLILLKYQGYTDEEIARKVGLADANALKKARYRAMEKLRNLLKSRPGLSSFLKTLQLDPPQSLIEIIQNLNKPTELLKFVDLSGQNLSEVPPQIRFISNLEKLNLSDNQLSRFPQVVFEIGSLQELNLSSNQIKNIPSGQGRSENLISLSLANNKLKEFPKVLSVFPNLQSLDLQKNNIAEIPDEIGQLKNLKSLNLSYNRIRKLPAGLGQLAQLETLHLSANKLEAIPPEIFQLMNLKHLYLTSNNIKKIPKEIEKLSQLETLHLNNNQIEILPAAISSLGELKSLEVAKNPIRNVPVEILNSGRLRIIRHLQSGQRPDLEPDEDHEI